MLLAVGGRDGCALAIEPRLLLRRRAILNDVLADAQDAQDVCEQAMKVRLNKCAVGLAHHCCHQRQDVDVQGSVGHDEGEGEVVEGQREDVANVHGRHQLAVTHSHSLARR